MIMHERIDAYLHAGVALVWAINPHDQAVMIYSGQARKSSTTYRSCPGSHTCRASESPLSSYSFEDVR